MAINVPTVEVGQGKQRKVVEPVLLTALDPDGNVITINADANGNLVAGSSPSSAPAVGNGGKLSVSNNTIVPLAAGASWVGEWEDVSTFDSMTVAVKTDQHGYYAVEFSPDGVNVDSSQLRYYRTNQIEAPHRFTIARQYLRITYTNSSASPQTFIRLQTLLGTKQPLNAPLDSVLAQDFDSVPTRPTDFKYEVALGHRQGNTTWNKFGYNDDVGLTSEIISSWGGTFTPLGTASTLSVVSSAAADADGLAGAHGVVIYGIDATRQSQIEVVMLTGVTPVVTTSTWLGINRVALFRSGSSISNVGNIAITAVSGGAIQARIPALQGTTQQCLFFTQVGHTALMDWLTVNVNRAAGGGADPVITIKGYVFSAVSNSRYEVFRVNVDTSLESNFQLNPSQPFVVGESSVFWLEAASTKTGSFVSARFSLIEHREIDSTTPS